MRLLGLLLLFACMSPGRVWAEEAVVEAPTVEPAGVSATAAPMADDEIEAMPAAGIKKKGNPMLTILAWSIMVAAAGFGAVVASRRRGGINPPGKKGNPLF